MFRWARRSILLIGCIFFLTLNVLILTTGFIQSALAATLAATGISTVYSAMDYTIRSKDRDIRKKQIANRELRENYREASKGKEQFIREKRKLTQDLKGEKASTRNLKAKLKKKNATIISLADRSKDLASKTQRLARSNNTLVNTNKQLSSSLSAQKAIVRNLGGNITRRSLKSAAVNVSSIPFESIPWLGAGVVAVVTGIELHMTCDNIKDMNKIYATMGVDPLEDPGAVEKTCLGYIQRVESIIEKVSGSLDMEKVNKWVAEILAKVGIGDEA